MVMGRAERHEDKAAIPRIAKNKPCRLGENIPGAGRPGDDSSERLLNVLPHMNLFIENLQENAGQERLFLVSPSIRESWNFLCFLRDQGNPSGEIALPKEESPKPTENSFRFMHVRKLMDSTISRVSKGRRRELFTSWEGQAAHPTVVVATEKL